MTWKSLLTCLPILILSPLGSSFLIYTYTVMTDDWNYFPLSYLLWLSLLLCLAVQYIFEIIFAEEICWLSLWYWKPMSCTFTATWKHHELPSALIVLISCVGGCKRLPLKDLWELMLCVYQNQQNFCDPEDKGNDELSGDIRGPLIFISD